MTTRTGILYGVGVGPGDPDLITVKGRKILRQVPRIFAAASPKNDYSLAQNIVGSHLNGAYVEQMDFPMTRDADLLEEAWERNARRAVEVLESGEDAAFITLGDPLTYSTFTYLVRTVKEIRPDLKVVTVPGITAYNAAAAVSNLPLTEGEQSLHLISGAKGGAKLREIIEASDTVVMLKTYKHFDDIYDTLEDLDLLDQAVCLSRCGLEGETVVEDMRSLRGRKMPYLSLIIIKKEADRGRLDDDAH